MGINRDLHVNFDPRGGAFDLSPTYDLAKIFNRSWILGTGSVPTLMWEKMVNVASELEFLLSNPQ